ncbi:hypothetical protein KKF34_10205 [Myxococcota bacterium]|nr:hypothetical protein [Myxococcota bacterium]MBU1380413.1 hypothetical protein [Myxococcota bacterium]MBU1497237.1 hypothetical protein [Myxococcota bacterium]
MKFLLLAVCMIGSLSCSNNEKKAPPDPDFWAEGLSDGLNPGLSADYPDDIGIASNEFVIAAEDFETGDVQIPTEEDRYALNVEVTSDVSYTGNYSAIHTWENGENGPTTRFILPASAHLDEKPAYFVRMCMMYDDSFHPEDLSLGVGVKGFGIYAESEGTNANTRCDGTNWYNASIQFVGWGPSQKPEANDGFLWVGHLYSYNPAPDRVDVPIGELNVTDASDGGTPYRFSVYATPFQYLIFNEWNCFEVGLYLNTPGFSDGEARLWQNGVLISRVTQMRYRDTEDLKPNYVQLNLHRTTEDFPQTMLRWVDNIVISRRYIGPVQKSNEK